MSKDSLDRLMRAKLRGAVKTYIKAKEELDRNPSNKNRDKERLLRGIVRGQAMLLLTFFRPSQHSDKEEVIDIEQEHGFPHERDRGFESSPTLKEFLRNYYDEP